ncbi:DUF3857 domain-containing protein [Pseudotenacibaculum haliotis]|uniref:DUF3857 domain-containing protein n=1 Tax=Pseudotenacibaculum haliotis TaxID=1862138 RepID=A0ABW5LY13_9FLAO
MKKKLLFSSLVFLLAAFQLFSQSEASLKVSTIPIELLEDSNVVIRQNDMLVNVKGIDQMEIKQRTVITVLNKMGDNFLNAFATAHYDNNSKIAKLEARIYNAQGKEIKKFSKKKFIDVSAVDGGTLYSDSRVMYMDYTPISYPYTMVFESEYKSSSTAFIPSWRPISSYYITVESSSFKVNYPVSMGITTKERNFEGFDIQNNSAEGQLHYTIGKTKSIKSESMAPSFDNLRPKLLVSLNTFSTEGVKGSYTNWKEFGNWMKDKILIGKDHVDEATQKKILALTSEAETDIEKAKIVYQFVQDKTRYISVQVGIGGIQPIAANQVDKVGYGDCKGLTNYTKALLDVVGVESYYVHVEANEGDQVSFEKDFASLIQGNHVILNIPNNGNDVWLECTNQSIPFGFLGDFTDNRDVLVVTSEGGVIKRTPAYLNEDNLKDTKATVAFDPQGNFTATLERKSTGIRYNNTYFLEDRSQKDQIEYYKSGVWKYNNNLEVESIELENDKDAIEFQEKLKLSAEGFASLSQDEFIFRINVFNRNSFVPKRYRNRKFPLKVNRGYKDVDEYTIKLPEGYSIITLPEKVNLTSKFGSYEMSIEKVDDSTLLYKKKLLIKHGLYPKEDYDVYRKFRRRIARYDNMKIALKKK